MIAWRIVKARHASSPLSTDGAREFGGRWNPKGVPVLYASASLSLAALEVFVNLQAARPEFVKVQIEVPDDCGITTWNEPDLPEDWRTLEGNFESQAMGAAWITAAPTLALSVPSVIVPEDRNILLTPFHAGFNRVVVRAVEPFGFDPRMWKPSP